jgi:hypothetical protein
MANDLKITLWVYSRRLSRLGERKGKEKARATGGSCADDDLLNKGSHLSDRRDFVLFHNGSFQDTEAEVMGASPADRSPSGFWPSDHAGVVAKLRLLS